MADKGLEIYRAEPPARPLDHCRDGPDPGPVPSASKGISGFPSCRPATVRTRAREGHA